MVLQFKTFGTVSSIFWHLSQYLWKEKKQHYADDQADTKSVPAKYPFVSLKAQVSKE